MIRKFGIAAVAVCAVAAFGLWFTGSRSQQAETSLLPMGAAQAQETPPADAAVPEVPELVLGNPDAKVTVTEYASYTCPHCATFHQAVFKPLKADYIDTGKIKFVFREVYFDRYGLWASIVARCGGEMRYFGIAGMLFETQQEWAASDDSAVVVENLKKIGRKAGMEDATISACLEDNAMAQAMVAAFQANATADKIEGTPALVINGTLHPNMSYGELKTLLDAELAK
ncbi:DsbA family protein [Paracoccaceae bacterium Fryx2]|nr:DsbA family protein [Paracoccaceae bacterium Fryx2]